MILKHHILIPDKNITHCGISDVIIRCRPRYGFCNLEENHQMINIFGYQKSNHHNAYAEMPSNMISVADEEDENYDICKTCLEKYK